MKILIPILILFAAPLLKASTHLRLARGMTKSFDAQSTDSVWIEKSKVIRAQEVDDKIQIQAMMPGISLLKIGKRSWQIEVIAQKVSSGFAALKAEVKNMMGLQVLLAGGQLTITGELLRLDDWVRISKLGHTLSWQANMNEPLRQKAEDFLNSLLKKQALPTGKLKLEPSPHFLISNQDPHLRMTAVLQKYGLRTEASPEQLQLAPMVRVKITIAEVRKEKLTRYGIQWPSAIKAGIQAGHSAAVITEDIEAVLNALSQEGKSQVLASPALLCRSGKEAEFLAGGEVPIRVGGYKSASLTWKKYGVLLRVSPLADRNGRMSIAITTEVSAIDPATTLDGMPGFLTNRIQTHFDLAASQTIVLSGLMKHLDGQSQEGLPGLGKLPILGPLFASKEFRNQKTELVAFVTPEIVDEQ